MSRFTEFGFFALMVLASRGANAQPLSLVTPFTAATVKDYVAICKTDSDLCSLEVAIAVTNKVDLGMSSEICAKSKNDDGAVLNWLIAHPETFQMKREDGIYLALKSIYPCG
jgi:hypothetical protein